VRHDGYCRFAIIVPAPLLIVVPIAESRFGGACGASLWADRLVMLYAESYHPAKRTHMHFGHTQYLPIVLPLFACSPAPSLFC
jgi:hypothetical protein